jgi:hypothetical protein
LLGSFFQLASIISLVSVLNGCGPTGDSPLILATTWPSTERTQIEAVYRERSGDRRPVVWVVLAPGERLDSVVDRRGGVDILLGGSFSTHERLVSTGRFVMPGPFPPGYWRPVRRPKPEGHSPGIRTHLGDPRLDPDSLAAAKSLLLTEGWPTGYEGLVRATATRPPIGEQPADGSIPLVRSEAVALVQGGPNPDRAKEFIHALYMRGISPPESGAELDDAAADELLADLLGSALVDSLDELREAQAALVRFGHPAHAEASIGERPPWPPASVAKMQADPSRQPMVETLLDEIVPDPASRAWLVESWSKPKRPIDGELLAQIARAADGKLAREPRFRAWLRGEWTAWTRQLYRRVARVAGGYIPS